MLDKIKNIYDKQYKLLAVIMIAVFFLSLGVLGYTYYTTGDFVQKDYSLKGGTLITVNHIDSIDVSSSESKLSSSLGGSVRITELTSVSGGGRIGYAFELTSGIDKDKALTEIGTVLGGELEEDSYTVEEISSSLGSTFWRSTIQAMFAAFIFMAAVVLVYFRKITPALAIVLTAVADFIETLAVMNLLGISVSTAGVAALLMIIGYSVDTDILLTTRLLKETGKSVLDRLISSIKTGLMMEGTTFAALLVLYVISTAGTLKMISLVLMIGLLLDTPNTWFMNAGILRWYLERKEAKNGQD